MAEKTSTNVKIKLWSSILPVEGDAETYEMWLEGQLIAKNGMSYLRYEEVQEGKTIQTTIKLTEDRAVIMRSGAVNMRLPLNTTQQERGHYDSQYGSIPLITKTHEIAILSDDKRRTFKTTYDLIIGGNLVGNYTLDIKFTEV